ncbi:MAG: aminotransferase class IV [Planctomycetota bacterium]|jgi:branched-chain amino acid aminotransferase
MHQQFNESNKDLIVNINGELVHRDRAGVSPFDSSVQNGDAVWEGLRLYDGRIFRLEAHIDRLFKSARMLSYEGVPTREHIVEQIRRTLGANDMRDGVHIRLTLSRGVKYTSGLDPRINTRGCSLFVLAEHKPPVYDKRGLRLITANHRRPPANVLNQIIHSSNQLTSILAKLEANAAGADDALMLDLDGNLAETNATHVFLARDGEIHTSTTDACPEGITRSTILELCQTHAIPHHVRDIPHAELYDANEIFTTGTMGELAGVVELDGRRIGDGTIGPMTRRLSALYTELTQHEGERLVDA